MNICHSICMTLLVSLISIPIFGQESCLSPVKLQEIDASWEKAQLRLDTTTLDNIMATDFIWVHNHAGTIDQKMDVINRAKRAIRDQKNNTKARISRDVEVIISGSTGIVSGYTSIHRGPQPTLYHFMRTYVLQENQCRLLANQTMAIPTE